MARPTMSSINSAIDTVFSVFSEDKTRIGAREGAQALQETFSKIANLYAPDVVVTITDGVDAGLTAMYQGGEVEAAFNAVGAELIEGKIFEVTGSGDSASNVLQGFKGTPLVAGDRFEVTGISSPNATFLGNTSTFDFTAEVDSAF